jgi:zeaxanthin glucosyltransferase
MICPPMHSHLTTTCALARELLTRGDEVAVVALRDMQPKVEAEGVPYLPIGEATHPLGTVPAFQATLGASSGLAALRFSIREVRRMNQTFFAEMPGIIERYGADALIADQAEPVGGTLAEHAGIPWATLCAALPLNREPDVPPCFMPWAYSPTALGRLRNRAGYALIDLFTRGIATDIRVQRRRWGLPLYHQPDDANSPSLQVVQLAEALDFPRRQRPPGFHYVGPFKRAESQDVPFPWEALDGRPVVYASMGTLQNRMLGVFHAIATACDGLAVQLVISLGGGVRRSAVGDLRGNPLVVEFAPQMKLLERSSLFITHGGLHSTLEALLHGVPMIALPVTGDQGAVAARVEWHGAGEALAEGKRQPAHLRAAILRVQNKPAYRERARQLQQAVAATGGAKEAADLVQQKIGRR